MQPEEECAIGCVVGDDIQTIGAIDPIGAVPTLAPLTQQLVRQSRVMPQTVLLPPPGTCVAQKTSPLRSYLARKMAEGELLVKVTEQNR